MDYYNVKVVNDIIYNDNTHLVSIFKDYLIFDDISEFLKRYYTKSETKTRLTKIYSFYDKYSKVFPNYITLEENKYMFKNIERKQIAIDERQQFFQDLEEKEKVNQQKSKTSNLSQLFDQDSNQMFDSKFVDSVANIKTNSQVTDNFPFDVVSRMADSDSKVEGGDRSRTVRLDEVEDVKREVVVKRLQDFDMAELVNKFLAKDSSMSESRCLRGFFIGNASLHEKEQNSSQEQKVEQKIKKYVSGGCNQNPDSYITPKGDFIA